MKLKRKTLGVIVILAVNLLDVCQTASAAPACRDLFSLKNESLNHQALSQKTLQEQNIESAAIPKFEIPANLPATAEQALVLKNIRETGIIFRNRVFWDYFEKDLSQVDILLHDWYRPLPDYAKEQIRAAAEKLGKYRVLLLDPGIAQRNIEFTSFATEKISANPHIDSFTLRQAFSDFLGTEILWHGEFRTPEELDNIKKRGLLGNIFHKATKGLLPHYPTAEIWDLQKTRRLFYEFFRPSDPNPNGPIEDIFKRLRGNLPESTFVSCSKWIEVTYAAVWTGNRGRFRSNINPNTGRFYLFKLQVPKLDVIRGTGIFYQLRGGWDNDDHKYTTVGLSGENWVKPFNDPDFEVFLQYVSPRPDEILEIIPFNSLPPQYRVN